MASWSFGKWTLVGIAAALSVGGVLVGADALAKPDPSKLRSHAINVQPRVIRYFSKSSRSDSFGRLKFRGGLVLKSGDSAFGGFSGLEISHDGNSIFAVSDAGAWLKAGLIYNGKRLIHLNNATVGPIKALSNRRLRRGRDRDAEAIRLLKGDFNSGTFLIGFEANYRIGFFGLAGGKLKPPKRYLRPPVRLNRNKSIEATAVIRRGRYRGAIVAFAERTLDPNGHHRGWMWHRAKSNSPEKVSPLALTDVGGFDITDATGGFGGDLYVLERRFRWSEGVKMRIRRIAADKIKPGALLRGETLIEADLGYEIDNMEGIAVHRDKDKRVVLTLISDDNFNSFLQRTVLLQFEVAE